MTGTPPPAAGPLPVAIVAGLHADARAETVELLLAAVPGSVALHHDLRDAAEHGTVVRTVRDTLGERDRSETVLVDDCACCALREDLVPELLRLAGGGPGGTPVRLAVVELWDSVEPRSTAEVIAEHGRGDLTVTAVITAVDPVLVLPCLGNGDDLADAGLAAARTDRRTVADTFARQLEYPPVLAVAVREEADGRDHALLRRLHPTARRIPLDAPGELARAAFAGFDPEAAAAAQHPASALLPQNAAGHGADTLVWHRTRPFHPERLLAALEAVTCAALRSRGRFWLADRPDTLLAWDAAGGALCVESGGPWLASLPDAAWELVSPYRRAAAAVDWHPEHGDSCQHLVFTSPGLDREALESLLDSCLLTDEEYAAGRDAWKRLPAAFDAYLS
ncbi:GTP-binding protein [Streptomyces sp. CAU 1734]|uniref:GTP-binding protein n=1 Tax=Streptomyces sp. CAU 1734 TaxID=3140360 RepID=UPI003260ACE5